MKNERGNVLFLILIAVALFAALSYAVTQSTRGGGNADSETGLITASQYLQYGAGLKVAITRMMISGTDHSSLDFGGGYLEELECSTGVDCVYAPEGGGHSYQETPEGVVWRHRATGGAGGVITDVGSAADDIYLHADVQSYALCQAINKSLNLASDPVESSNGGGTSNINAYPGEPIACYESFPGSLSYAFYYVLVER
jgi:hypothetical protein